MRSPSAGLTAILSISAGLFIGFHLLLALGREDVDKYESPLMLSVARQLVAGPWELYGPFGGSNPLVLIHAPLYYRAAAMLAWPMAQAGLHPVEAARVAGRLISVLGLAATMAAAYRLGRLGGLPRRAGWWSAMAFAASPALAGQPFAVRPDLAGVALQSWGVVLAMESVAGTGRRLAAASVLFGLASCVKQHLLAAWAVSAALAAWRRPRPVAVWRAIVPGMTVAGLIYAAESLATGGRVWGAAFVAAANVGRVHPGEWLQVATFVAAIVGKGPGLAALAAAGASARWPRAPGWIRGAAALLVAAIAALSVAQLVASAPWVTAMLPAVAMAGLAIGLAGCAAAGRIEAALGLYGAAEVVLMVALCRSSSGAWINYGIPALVFAAVLAGRALAVADGSRRAPPIAAAVAVLASVLMDARVEANRRRDEHADLARVLAASQAPPSAVFFADRPGLNRMTGRLDRVYDDWLYPAFESKKLAEPRGRWLGAWLGPSSAVRAVVLESDGPRVDGLPESLPALGFRRAGRFGPFRAWIAEHNTPGAP